MVTGIGAPGSIFCVCALNALQNSMMFNPRWPSAGPIGGLGFALPAGTCNLMKPTIFFAIFGLLVGSSGPQVTARPPLGTNCFPEQCALGLRPSVRCSNLSFLH